MQRYRDTGMERPKGLEGLKDGAKKKMEQKDGRNGKED